MISAYTSTGILPTTRRQYNSPRRSRGGFDLPKGLSSVVRDNLEKCRSAAIAAVDVYSRPGPRFRTAHYIVLIIIAWTALLHAMLYKKGTKPWYQRRKGANPRGDRYEHVGGDLKHWDLSECLRQHFGSENPPERTTRGVGLVSASEPLRPRRECRHYTIMRLRSSVHLPSPSRRYPILPVSYKYWETPVWLESHIPELEASHLPRGRQ